MSEQFPPRPKRELDVSIPKSADGGSEGEPSNARFMRRLTASISFLSLVLASDPLNHDHDPKFEAHQARMDQAAERERMAKVRQKARICGIVDPNLDRDVRFKPFIRGHLKRIFTTLSELGDCTNPNAVAANKEAVCQHLTKLLEREKAIDWRKIDYFKVVGPTLALVSGSIRCGEVEDFSGIDKTALTKLADMIDAKLLAEYKLIDPNLSIDTICKPAFELLGKKAEDITTIARYLVRKKNLLTEKEHPVLKRMIAASVEKHGETNLESQLTAGVTKAAQYSALAGMACAVGPDRIASSLNVDLANFQKTRRDVPAMVRELAKLIGSDTSEDSDPVAEAFLSVTTAVAKAYP